MPAQAITDLETRVERLAIVLTPDGDPSEADGTLNPACARTRDGALVLYPRDVAAGNISRIGLVHARTTGSGDSFERAGFALEPQAPYELRPHPGYGCEDPRVTFIPALDRYVMTYTAFGPNGPRIAVALSSDAIAWQRLGLMRFEQPGMHVGDDKDAAFFSEPVLSPSGVESFAFYHRPMLHLSAIDGRAAIPMIEEMPFVDRESIRIGYVACDRALRDPEALLDVCESELVLSPNADWGPYKLGAGTPPVRIAEGWMSLYHAVDVIDQNAVKPKFKYSAGIVIHDYLRPHTVLYRSPKPILTPELEIEQHGIVDNVVFPTGIDPRPDLGERTFDVYYGMADWAIGAARLTVGASVRAEEEAAESAA